MTLSYSWLTIYLCKSGVLDKFLAKHMRQIHVNVVQKLYSFAAGAAHAMFWGESINFLHISV